MRNKMRNKVVLASLRDFLVGCRPVVRNGGSSRNNLGCFAPRPLRCLQLFTGTHFTTRKK